MTEKENKPIVNIRQMLKLPHTNATSNETNRLRRLEQIVLVITILGSILTVAHTVGFFIVAAWQLLAIAAIHGLNVGLALFAWRIAHQGKLNQAAYIVVGAPLVAGMTIVLFQENMARPMAIVTVLIAALMTRFLFSRQHFLQHGIVSLFGAGLIIALDQMAPWPRFINPNNGLNILLVYGILAAIVLVLIGLAAYNFRTATIHARLLAGSIILVLSLLIAIGGTGVILSTSSTQDQVIAQLESVATLKESSIQQWVHELNSNLSLMSFSREIRLNSIFLLGGETNAIATSEENATQQLTAQFKQIIEETAFFSELFIINSQGQTILSSESTEESKIHAHQSYFQEGLKGSHVSAPFYSISLNQTTVVTSLPIIDKMGEVVGVLAGRASIDTLNEILRERAGLGSTGETYLVSTNYAILSATRSGKQTVYVRTEATDATLAKNANGSGLYSNYQDNDVVGVYRWLPDLQVALVAEQEQDEAFQASTRIAAINIGVSAALLILAIGGALLLTRSIADPLAELAQTAARIADGDLSLTASIVQDDEIGQMAQAFNNMTSQLREYIGSLEQRVADRTRAIELSAKISQRLSTILDIDHLLVAIVEQIQSAFDYYHVHIYLFDEAKENLMMAGGTGEAGQAMLAQDHSIPFGVGLVGQAAQTNIAFLVQDVSKDENWLANPLLPETKSETAVPIAIGDEVLGVLDVQHNVVNGLNQGNMDLLQSITSQVALALRNARNFVDAQDRAQQEALVNHINHEIDAADTIEEVMQVTVRELGRALGADQTAIRFLENGRSKSSISNEK